MHPVVLTLVTYVFLAWLAHCNKSKTQINKFPISNITKCATACDSRLLMRSITCHQSSQKMTACRRKEEEGDWVESTPQRQPQSK